MSTLLPTPTVSMPPQMDLANSDATRLLTRSESPPHKSRLDKTQLIRGHYRRLTLEGFRTVPQEKSVFESTWKTNSEASVESDETKVEYGEGCITQRNANYRNAGDGRTGKCEWGSAGISPIKNAGVYSIWSYYLPGIEDQVRHSMSTSPEVREAFYQQANILIGPAPQDTESTTSLIIFPTLTPYLPRSRYGQCSTYSIPEAYPSGVIPNGSNKYDIFVELCRTS